MLLNTEFDMILPVPFEVTEAIGLPPPDWWNELPLAEKQLRLRLLEAKPGRNDSCICGSGKKFKKCCSNNIASFTQCVSLAGMNR